MILCVEDSQGCLDYFSSLEQSWNNCYWVFPAKAFYSIFNLLKSGAKEKKKLMICRNLRMLNLWESTRGRNPFMGKSFISCLWKATQVVTHMAMVYMKGFLNRTALIYIWDKHLTRTIILTFFSKRICLFIKVIHAKINAA